MDRFCDDSKTCMIVAQLYNVNVDFNDSNSVDENSINYEVKKKKREFYLSQTEDYNPGKQFLRKF